MEDGKNGISLKSEGVETGVHEARHAASEEKLGTVRKDCGIMHNCANAFKVKFLCVPK